MRLMSVVVNDQIPFAVFLQLLPVLGVQIEDVLVPDVPAPQLQVALAAEVGPVGFGRPMGVFVRVPHMTVIHDTILVQGVVFLEHILAGRRRPHSFRQVVDAMVEEEAMPHFVTNDIIYMIAGAVFVDRHSAVRETL